MEPRESSIVEGREEALRLSEERFRTLFEAAPVGITVSHAGTLVYANPAYVRMFGYDTVGEVLCQPFSNLIAPDLRPELQERNRRREQGEGVPSSYETVGLRRDGSTFHFRVEVTRLDLTDGPATFAFLTDITDQKEAERALREASEAKDRFLATLSHELRTPLTPVLAVVSQLERDERLDALVREELAMIRRNVELEARLIDDLLDLTRITRGKLELHPEIVDLRQVVDHALQTCCPPELAATLPQTVVLLDPGDHRVWGDAARLTQVLCNLLSNAMKFTPAGGTIALSSRRVEEDAGDRLLLEVADTGLGIEPGVLPRIFDGFEQGDRAITRRFGGLGLGLAISKAIAEMHGGSLSAASEGRGRGSVFTVRLPLADPALLVAQGAPVPGAEAASPASADRAQRILLVEDHADTAAAMAELLRMMGHEVQVAASVAAALDAAARGPEGIDLVLSDLGLPDGSGFDLMRELVRRHGLRGIALSGYGMEEDVRRSREAGFETHLTKPVSLQVLRAALRQAAQG